MSKRDNGPSKPNRTYLVQSHNPSDLVLRKNETPPSKKQPSEKFLKRRHEQFKSAVIKSVRELGHSHGQTPEQIVDVAKEIILRWNLPTVLDNLAGRNMPKLTFIERFRKFMRS